MLGDGGRLVVVTFHSLEDGIVKSFLDSKSGKQVNQSRHIPNPTLGQIPDKVSKIFEVKKRKAVVASEKEIEENPRSRSAKMRVAYRIRESEAVGA